MLNRPDISHHQGPSGVASLLFLDATSRPSDSRKIYSNDNINSNGAISNSCTTAAAAFYSRSEKRKELKWTIREMGLQDANGHY
ncbi:hypothetical protein CUMW_038820 [Citrus unshiu]|nr:hypothetical protein CUMW_038820 [Citrus unshiu]